MTNKNTQHKVLLFADVISLSIFPKVVFTILLFLSNHSSTSSIRLSSSIIANITKFSQIEFYYVASDFSQRNPLAVLDHLQNDQGSQVELGSSPVSSACIVPDFVVSSVANPVEQRAFLLFFWRSGSSSGKS